MAFLVFKTSVGFARIPGGFDPHSPPPNFRAALHNNTSFMPRRAIFATTAAIFGLVLLVSGYARPGLQVVGKKEVEVQLPPDPGMPDGPVPAWMDKPPTTQKVMEDFAATLGEQSVITLVTMGAISRTAGGELLVTETKAGSPRCPT